MTLEEAITVFESNAEYEKKHENLNGFLIFKQLAGWLQDYKDLIEKGKNKELVEQERK